MAELRYNFQSGVLGTNLNNGTGSQTITNLFAVAPDFATLTGSDYIKLSLSETEIVYLTAYTSGSLDGTITRAAEDAANFPSVAHGAGDPWSNSPTVDDFATQTPPGVAIVRAFPFVYNTPDILTGADMYTPTVGDILLNAWISVTTAWDGTTPLADISNTYVTASAFGWFAETWSPIDMSIADQNVYTVPGLLQGGTGATLEHADVSALLFQTFGQDGTTGRLTIRNPGFPGSRTATGQFTSSNPVQLVVTTTGSTFGSDPGSTQGAAILYLVTATPA